MDEFKTMGSLGLTLPTPAYLFGTLLFAIIGFAAYRYGKKGGVPIPKWGGVALMIYPYGVSETWLLYLIGTILCVAVYRYRE